MHQEIVVDWFQVLTDLKKVGLSMYDVSDLIDVPKATLLSWKNDGAQPRYDPGSKLVALWCARRNQNQDELPRRKAPMSAARAKRDT